MCGRTVLVTPGDDLRELFALDEIPPLVPRYNIAPTQPIAVIREPRRLELLRWGLILPRSMGPGINVRVETAARVPAYRESFQKRRCLVIVDGFYEWKRLGKKAKQPYLIHREDGRPWAFAGIWTTSTTKDGELIDTCAIITGEARGVVVELHDRMPIAIGAEAFDRWLDPNVRDVADLLLPDALGLIAHPVSPAVNTAANDDPRCLERVEPMGPRGNLSLFYRSHHH